MGIWIKETATFIAMLVLIYVGMLVAVAMGAK